MDLLLLRKATVTGQRGLDWHRLALDTGGCCGDTQWRMQSCPRAWRLLVPKRLVLPGPKRNDKLLNLLPGSKDATRGCWLRTQCASMKLAWEGFSTKFLKAFLWLRMQQKGSPPPSLSSSKLMNTLETEIPVESRSLSQRCMLLFKYEGLSVTGGEVSPPDSDLLLPKGAKPLWPVYIHKPQLEFLHLGWSGREAIWVSWFCRGQAETSYLKEESNSWTMFLCKATLLNQKMPQSHFDVHFSERMHQTSSTSCVWERLLIIFLLTSRYRYSVTTRASVAVFLETSLFVENLLWMSHSHPMDGYWVRE